MVSILLGVWNGGGVCCCCPAQCGGVARALLIPLQCWRVLLSCRALLFARCCGVWVVSVCLWCSCGGVSSVCPSPRRGGGWGRRGWWGAVVDGGWHGDGRAAVLLTPRRMLVSPVLCVVSPFCLRGGPVEWREWCVL